VALRTVQRLLARAQGKRVDRVDWSDQRHASRRPSNRTISEIEDMILTVRRELKETSALGEYGDEAIARALEERGVVGVPSVRTIGRILERRGALDGRYRIRRPAPPKGWYLPEVARGLAELDSFDAIEGLVIKQGPAVEILTGISLHGGLPAAWPDTAITAKYTVERLVEHWRAFGRPTYAQFDNDMRFQGPHAHADSIGRVTRLCLSLAVTPVFTVPRETGFQAQIESLNGRWQAKVWSRFCHPDLAGLQDRSRNHIAAVRQRAAARIEAAPRRRPFPKTWLLNLQAPLRGTIIFLRRTTETGRAELLGRSFEIDRLWPHRLVRAEVDLIARRIRFYALRRRDPDHQPLLNEVSYQPTTKRFRE
jgi:hypothetical protein